MKGWFVRFLENAGIGALFLLPAFILYAVYSIFIAPLNRWGNFLLEIVGVSRKIPLAGFLLVFMLMALIGFILRRRRFDFSGKELKSKFLFLSLIAKGARSGTIGLILRSRRAGAPNVVLAPYFRKNGPWPFVILKVFSTSDPECPVISGVFLDFPFIAKGGTINAADRIFADISFEEAFLFAVTAGAGLENFSRPPRITTAGELIKTEEFQKFMQESLPPR